MSHNIFSDDLNNMDNNDNQMQIQSTILTNELISDDEVDKNIISERNQSIHEISQEVEELTNTWNLISKLIYDQGENLNVAENHVEMTEINTNEAVNNLKKAGDHMRDRLIVARDISIVIGGGVIGLPGFLLGPFVGIGTVIAGGAAGGAAVAGLHKLKK